MPNRISYTAWLVMACQLGLKRLPRWRALVPDDHADFYRSCYEYCLANSFFCHAQHYLLPLGAQLWLVERALAFGAPQHFALRKQAIARHVLQLIGQGARQVVVIGGGFDALALHMARAHRGVEFFELDTPAMHHHKINAARMHFGDLPANFHGLGNDFSRRSLRQALEGHHAFSRQAPTAFIAEGVMMYLRQEEVIRLLQDMRALCSAPPSFIFTAIENHHEKSLGLWKILRSALLMARKERFRWGLPLQELPEFLVAQGFHADRLVPYADLQAEFRTAGEMERLRRARGEYLAYAVAD